jgi:hypothetical protein
MIEMKRFSSLLRLSPLLLALLSGCGGSGGPQLAEGGMGGSGISMGRASSFDPLIVNGDEFDTSNSDFVYEEETAGEPGDDSRLKVGMVVRVTSAYNSEVHDASLVEYAKLLEGAITSNDVTPGGIGTLEALGQHIIVNVETVYDDGEANLEIPLSDLPAGAMIELSGFTDGKGTILATRIDLKSMTHDTETRQEIKGLVSDLEESSNRFRIGALSIDYTGLDLPAGFADGVYVEVKGFLINATLEASHLEIEGDGDLSVANDGDWVEMEGIVTELILTDDNGTLFVLNGQQVLADSSTRYDPGRKADDIVFNQPMKVEGRMEGSILVADYIDIKVSPADKSRITATLDGIDKEAGLLTLLGQSVTLLPSTLYEDETNPRFNLSKVEVGDYLELNVTLDEASHLVASKLKKQHGPEQVEIEGVVQGLNPTEETLEVFNIRVHFPGLAGLGLAIGDHVALTGSYDATTATVEANSMSATDNLQSIPPGLD